MESGLISDVLRADLEELLEKRDWRGLREALMALEPSDVAEILMDLPPEHAGPIFRILPRGRAAELLTHLPVDQQEALIDSLSSEHVQAIVNLMSPDDRTRLLDELPAEIARALLERLPPDQIGSAKLLLGYAPDSAGRYMTPQYIGLRPEMTASEAIDYIRRFSRPVETLNVVYVVDPEGMLIKDLQLSTLVRAAPDAKVRELEDRPLVSVLATDDREDVVGVFEKYDRIALAVTDTLGHMLGIITVDDVLDVQALEATEDMQKIGGMEALEDPYLSVPVWTMFRKRGVWLSILFAGQLLTATVMERFEASLAQVVALTLFIPLIISSGGNSGSQATSLIIRALATREVRLRDWWRVLRREFATAALLGVWLGLLGLVRIILWHTAGWGEYDQHLSLAITISFALLGVVLWGSLVGSMLPFILERIGLDPATSSAPFVATLVDVTGLVIYFTTATLIMAQL
ncbi:MAG: magnesium transporter [Phycisphaeraceae bacterium]